MPPGPQMIAIKSRKIGESNQATKMERSTINRVLGGEMGIENQMPEKEPTIPVKYVKKLHMESYLSARSSKNTFQASQGDQLVHLRKSATNA